MSQQNQFDAEQEYYLDLLSKFSGREKKVNVVQSQDMPSKKMTYIKDNLNFLKIDEQVSYNKSISDIKRQSTYSMIFAGSCGMGLMFYFIVTRPLQKNLYHEAFKSFVFGSICGIAYNRVQQYWFNEQIHNIYLITLQRTKGRRVF